MFRRWRLLHLLDKCHYTGSYLLHAPGNALFRLKNPNMAMPPLRWLHDTYRCDLSRFWEDGRNTAKELIDRAKTHIGSEKEWQVLDWGCGAARITRHLPAFKVIATVTGADVHTDMIAWHRHHLPGINFDILPPAPPVQMHADQFHLIIGISVLTHIPAERQSAWLLEIKRLLRRGGVFIFTTHGKAFDRLMDPAEKKRLQEEGCLTQSYPEAGHRMMTTIHDAEKLRSLLSIHFDVMSHIDGKFDPEAAGGQDLWIVKKRAAKD